MNEMFSGTLRLARFTLRKERFYIIAWLSAFLLIASVMLITFEHQFTEADLYGFLIMKDNPAHIALQGPFFEVDNFQVGHFYAIEMHLFTLVAVAIFNIFFIVKNTRGDEEQGRYEVLRSLPVGRLSNLNAVMLIIVAVNVLLAVSHGVLLSLLGISGITIVGAFFFGATLGATGIFFSALTALLSQLFRSARTVVGYAFIVLITSYLLRALGDVTIEILSLISPLGLPQRAEVFVSNHIWPIIIMLIYGLILYGLAYAFNIRRDIAQGLIPEKQGRSHASIFLRSSLGLIWRQTRIVLLSWAIGLFGFGAAMGGILRDAEYIAGESGAFQMLLPHSADFTAIELLVMYLNVGFVVICAAPVLIMIFKLISEEKEGRVESILSGAISRQHYLSGYILLALATSFVMPFVTGFGLWFVSLVMMEYPLKFISTIHSIMVYVPSLWVMLGLGVFAVGIIPKASVLCWVYFVYIFIVGFFGDMLNMPKWSINLSPISHVPQLPLEDMQLGTLVILTLIALVLTAIGLIFYRKRDVGT